MLSGLIMGGLHRAWLFWIGAVPVSAAMVLVWRLMPEPPVRTASRRDWRGAPALSAGLVALLLTLSEGRRRGWLSAPTLAAGAAALAALAAWVAVELRVDDPLVDIGMMRDRSVFRTNLVALLTGFSMFGVFLPVPILAQIRAGSPSPDALRPAGDRARVVLAGGRPRQHRRAVLGMGLVGTGVGFTYAMIAKLVVDAVSPSVTGAAMGMNTVMRTMAGASAASWPPRRRPRSRSPARPACRPSAGSRSRCRLRRDRAGCRRRGAAHPAPGAAPGDGASGRGAA